MYVFSTEPTVFQIFFSHCLSLWVQIHGYWGPKASGPPVVTGRSCWHGPVRDAVGTLSKASSRSRALRTAKKPTV